MCFAFGRLGAVVTPFVAQVLLKLFPYSAFTAYAASGLIAAVLALRLPLETLECSMPEKVDFKEGSMHVGGETQPCDYLYW
jgi:hypothetical protein